jgi:hypothetical protein
MLCASYVCQQRKTILLGSLIDFIESHILLMGVSDKLPMFLYLSLNLDKI